MNKPNMSLKKTPMPVLDPASRVNCFDEVALGYTEEDALSEATRCLHCKDPACVKGCPVNIAIPDFIGKIKEKDFEGAYEVISRSSSLPAVCGRVCPQESQCEKNCVRALKGEAVGIGRLERFAADCHNRRADSPKSETKSNGHKVAVVGSGPSGLACAGELAKRGYETTVFEALHLAGGVLVYGIPEFRLPKRIVEREIEELEKRNVRVETNVVIGKTLSVDDLFSDGYEAVFIGTGAGLPRFMGIPGESLKGVYSANEFLTRVNLMKAYKSDSPTPVMRARRVAVVGGGNVAMDAARTALRLGAEKVYIVYRRSFEELPARREEAEHAMEEGIEFRFLENPVEILGYFNPDDRRDKRNGFVTGMRTVKMKLGKPDATGRRSSQAIEGSETTLDVDAVIMAIGTSPNPLVGETTEGLKTDGRGRVVVESDTGKTTREGVFAGGDAVTGAATVILAMGAGKRTAEKIDEYIRSRTKRGAEE